MRGVVMYTAGDVRVEEREDPKIIDPADATVKLTATCVCGSDLWPCRGIEPADHQVMGHEYVGMVEDVGSAVKTVKPGTSLSVRSSSPTTPARSAGPGSSPSA